MYRLKKQPRTKLERTQPRHIRHRLWLNHICSYFEGLPFGGLFRR